MARFINKGTEKKPKFEIDTEASTSKDNRSSADKAKAANEAEAQAAPPETEGAK